MLLKHKTRFCEITHTKIFSAPVFKHQIKNITPYKVYSDNIELFDAFGDTVANFCPVSVNIVDYWNKTFETHDTYVWDPVGEKIKIEIKDPAFGFKKGPFHGFKNIRLGENPYPGIEEDGSKITTPPNPNDPKDVGKGYDSKTGDGRLLGTGRRSAVLGDNELPNGDCIDSNNRFFVNPLIGLQDKLAMTYLNNFYKVLWDARQNTVLRHRLLNIAYNSNNEIDPGKFFNNPNALFDEEKTVTNKTFIMKKGTPLGLKYAQKSAFDAQLQGPMSIFNMKIRTPEPLVYHIESNVLEELFEKFVKPLAHPIGFIYDYKSVCPVNNTDVDHPLIKYSYKSKLIEINCLCSKRDRTTVDLLDQAIGSQEDKKASKLRCGSKFQPPPKVIAKGPESLVEIPDPKNPGKTISHMPGLWDMIGEDEWGIENEKGEIKFNILKDYKHGYDKWRGHLREYKKYIFENLNYLIAWIEQPKVQDDAPKVTLEYYRKDYASDTGWEQIFVIENEVHCDIADNLTSTREHQVTEAFKVMCIPSENGPFIMDVKPSDPNHHGPDHIGEISKGDVLGTRTIPDPKDPTKTITVDIIKFRGFMTNYLTTGRAKGGKLVGSMIWANVINTLNTKTP